MENVSCDLFSYTGCILVGKQLFLLLAIDYVGLFFVCCGYAK